MKSLSPRLAGIVTALAVITLLQVTAASAAVVLNNGGFEDTAGGQTSNDGAGPTALGGIVPTYWTAEQPFNTWLQNTSVPSPAEANSATEGSRFLRLADDFNFNTSAGPGAVWQNLGTMVAGDKYTVTGDFFQGITFPGDANIGDFNLLAEFRTAGGTGGSQLASTSGVILRGVGGTDTFRLEYTATGPDGGNALFLRLSTSTPTPGVVRGGVDRLQLGINVPSPAALPAGLIAMALVAMRRRR